MNIDRQDDDALAVNWSEGMLEWVTPELALDNWRERITRVAAEESAYLASLPYVKGVAIIGSAGRDDPWPMSDVDMLVMAEHWQGKDPEDLLRTEEQQRNDRLARLRIPNTVEAGNWVLTRGGVERDVSADDDAFYKTLKHPHWRGIVIKSQGARVVADPSGMLGRF